MASSYTVNNGIEKPAAGEQEGAWGGTLNTNFDIIDRVLSGVGSISLSGTTHTLTTTDGTLTDGMYKVLVLGGSPSGTNTITISPNDQDKLYFVVNSSGQTATFTQGSGSNVSIATGTFDIIYADGAGAGAAVSSLLANSLTLSSDAAILGFGEHTDVLLTHVADTGLNMSVTGNNVAQLGVVQDKADANTGPVFNLTRYSAGPADADAGGIIQFLMENSADELWTAAQIYSVATDVTDGSEDGKLIFNTMKAGTATIGLEIVGGKIGSSAYSPVGSVVQVVQSAAAASTTTSESLVDITNATLNITPQSTSNKVLVLWSNSVIASLVASTNIMYYQKLFRDATGLVTRYHSPQSGSGGLQMYGEISIIILDSPSRFKVFYIMMRKKEASLLNKLM